MTRLIGPDVEDRLDWLSLTRALAEGHERPPAEVRDSFIQKDGKTLLTRSAWIDGLGIAVKVATVFPENPAAGKPAVGGVMSLLSDADGALEAVIDFHLVTKWKTAGDSLLAARKLARPDSRSILIVGAGTVGASLRRLAMSLLKAGEAGQAKQHAERCEAICQQMVVTRLSCSMRMIC